MRPGLLPVMFLRALARALRRLARLAERQATRAAGKAAEAQTTGIEPGGRASPVSSGPPAHWLNRTRSSGPPAHWLERIRRARAENGVLYTFEHSTALPVEPIAPDAPAWPEVKSGAGDAPADAAPHVPNARSPEVAVVRPDRQQWTAADGPVPPPRTRRAWSSPTEVVSRKIQAWLHKPKPSQPQALFLPTEPPGRGEAEFGAKQPHTTQPANAGHATTVESRGSAPAMREPSYLHSRGPASRVWEPKQAGDGAEEAHTRLDTPAFASVQAPTGHADRIHVIPTRRPRVNAAEDAHTPAAESTPESTRDTGRMAHSLMAAPRPGLQSQIAEEQPAAPRERAVVDHAAPQARPQAAALLDERQEAMRAGPRPVAFRADDVNEGLKAAQVRPQLSYAAGAPLPAPAGVGPAATIQFERRWPSLPDEDPADPGAVAVPAQRHQERLQRMSQEQERL